MTLFTLLKMLAVAETLLTVAQESGVAELAAGQGLRFSSAAMTGLTLMPLCRQRTLRLGNVVGRRDASRAVQTSGLALAFVVAEEKGLVFDNGSAQRAAELVVVEGGFGGGGGVKESCARPGRRCGNNPPPCRESGWFRTWLRC